MNMSAETFVALVTCFADDEEINYAATRAQVRRQIAAGNHIMCCGTNGDFTALTFEEKARLAQEVVDEVAGRVKVFVNVGTPSTHETKLLAKRVAALGVDGLAVVAPYFIACSQDGLVRHFSTIADSVDKPVYLYNIPARTQNPIEPETAMKLAAHGNIAGIKDSAGSKASLEAYLAVAKANPGFDVYSGPDSLVLRSLENGAYGCISGLGNVQPNIYAEIRHAFVQGRREDARAAQETIKVGTIFPLSGGAGPLGQHMTQAVQSMAELINEDGGVLGKKIEIISRDDESTPAVGVSRATELIGQGVAVVIEGFNSPVTLAMQPVLARAGLLDITVSSKADPILSGEGNPLAIRMNSSNAQDGAVIAAYIIEKQAKRVAFLTENDAYGNGAQASIESELEKRNYDYEKVAEEKFPFTQADFRVVLTNVRAANPDLTVLINANDGLGMPALIRQARQARLGGLLVTAVGALGPSVIEIAGQAANGLISADIYFPDAEPFASNPANQRFVAKNQQMFQYTPDKYMALSATALQVWAMAANDLKTLEREAIAKRIRGGSFRTTVMGDVTFEPNGQLRSQHYIYTVENGKIAVQK